MKEFKFDYDSENDDLFIYSGKSKSKGSVELGDIIFDFDSDGNIVAIQIMNAVKFIKEIVGDKYPISKKNLESIKLCKINFKFINNLILVKILLVMENIEIPVPLQVPSIKTSSPALRY